MKRCRLCNNTGVLQGCYCICHHGDALRREHEAVEQRVCCICGRPSNGAGACETCAAAYEHAQ